jgi:hypothetical protein
VKLLKGNRLEPDWLDRYQSRLRPGCTGGLCLPTTVFFEGKNLGECSPSGCYRPWDNTLEETEDRSECFWRRGWALFLMDARISASGGASVLRENSLSFLSIRLGCWLNDSK